MRVKSDVVCTVGRKTLVTLRSARDGWRALSQRPHVRTRRRRGFGRRRHRTGSTPLEDGPHAMVSLTAASRLRAKLLPGLRGPDSPRRGNPVDYALAPC